MLETVKGLHDLGFALHFLQPKSKMPIEKGWSKGPRKSWAELKKQYRPGMNVGVRLGEASKLDDYYLACIDVDIKNPASREIAEKRLAKLLEPYDFRFPEVRSGSGNGSRHLYCTTLKPFKMITVEKHKEWEICIYSDGRQMALPPSVHPKGPTYKWEFPIINGIPLFHIVEIQEQESKVDTDKTPFEAVDVDLYMRGLSKRVINLITEGEGGEDGSADLFTASLAMCGAGFSDNEIMSVLTDREYFLGATAFKHTGSNSRRRAAEWIRNYTITRARRETSFNRAFDDAVRVEEMSSGKSSIDVEDERVEELLAFANEKAEQAGVWRGKLDCVAESKGGGVKNTLKNIVSILENSIPGELFRFNEFAVQETYGIDSPWGEKKGQEVRDIDLKKIKLWLATHWQIEPNINIVGEAVSLIANKNRFHPVKDYLNSLPPWDGVERIDTWTQRLLGATGPKVYLEAVSRKILIAMIARIKVPGIKFDTTPVLVGEQGVMKSTSIRDLASPWGSDVDLNIGDKDAVLAMCGAWVVELGEMSALSNAEVEDVKRFVACATDRIRVPHGKRTEAFPRQCIFIGTTNRDEFLKDETGNRRWWPIDVGICNPKGILAERDQLFAEALVAYEMGEIIYLTKEEESIAKGEQEKRMIGDILEEKLADLLVQKTDNLNTSKFTLKELFSEFEHTLLLRDDRATQLRVGRCLRRIGYRKVVLRGEGSVSAKFWVRENYPKEG